MWYGSIEFKHLEALFGLLLIPLIVAAYIYFLSKGSPSLQFPNIHLFLPRRKTVRQRMKHLPFILRMLCLTALLFTLARPQVRLSRKEITTEGIDIMLALDVSGSMLAEDFIPNRLEAAKEVAKEFIQERRNDRIGIVTFSGEVLTLCPLTSDHITLLNQLQHIKNGMLEDGTALGDGLSTAINRIKDSKAVSKVVILLTDGENNMGSIDPQTAAEIASLFQIRVYTIGVGRHGVAPYPFTKNGRVFYQNIEVRINEPLMKQMASSTNGGHYFRATDEKSLKEIFKDIDRMERTKLESYEYSSKREIFLPILLFAFFCLALETLLHLTLLKTMP